jgi:hypothetical protein
MYRYEDEKTLPAPRGGGSPIYPFGEEVALSTPGGGNPTNPGGRRQAYHPLWGGWNPTSPSGRRHLYQPMWGEGNTLLAPWGGGPIYRCGEGKPLLTP